MEDIHGYKKTKVMLEHIANLLIKEKKEELAEVVLRATAFYGGMPSEFLGESWLALKTVLKQKEYLSETVVSEAKILSDLIEEGFARVGQKLNKD